MGGGRLAPIEAVPPKFFETLPVLSLIGKRELKSGDRTLFRSPLSISFGM